MIRIKSEKMSYGINFPSSVKEITPEILNSITYGIKLPKHYCIIALAFTTKIFDFCAAMNNQRETNVSVTPILAKISDKDSQEINAEVGDKIIIDRSSLERGSHINIKTAINSNFVRQYFNKDTNLAKAVVSKSNDVIGYDCNLNKQLLASQSPNIVILEFKICPVTDIVASIPMNNNELDPFLIKDNNMN